MRGSLPYLIPLAVPLLALSYGTGDHFRWWDDLRGRTSAVAGLNRLARGEGNERWLYAHEPEFSALQRVINSRTENRNIARKVEAGVHFSAITRPATEVLKTGVPESWPNVNFVPETVPVMYVDVLIRKEGMNLFPNPHRVDNTEWVGSVGDVRRWIEDDRNRERFWVSTVLIGMLSIGLAIVGGTKR